MDNPNLAARHVPPGTSWAFTQHRTMAQVILAEQLTRLAVLAHSAADELAHLESGAFFCRLIAEAA